MYRRHIGFILPILLLLTACDAEPPEISDWEQFLAACSSCSPCRSEDHSFCVKQGESWCRPLCPSVNGYAWVVNRDTHVCRCPDSKKYWSFDTLDLLLTADDSIKEVEIRAADKKVQRQTQAVSTEAVGNRNEDLGITAESQNEGDHHLFKGLYKESKGNYYLRFFKQGTVIGASTSGTTEEILSWFNKDFSTRGTYETDGSQIRFELVSTNGVIKFEGEFEEKKLLLSVHSLISDYREMNVTYDLIP